MSFTSISYVTSLPAVDWLLSIDGFFFSSKENFNA